MLYKSIWLLRIISYGFSFAVRCHGHGHGQSEMENEHIKSCQATTAEAILKIELSMQYSSIDGRVR